MYTLLINLHLQKWCCQSLFAILIRRIHILNFQFLERISLNLFQSAEESWEERDPEIKFQNNKIVIFLTFCEGVRISLTFNNKVTCTDVVIGAKPVSVE